MTSTEYDAFASQPTSNQWLPLVLLLFIGSGCAALIYEIVWLQMLQLVIGSSAVSLGVLLGTFMGGMCLGSLLLPRWFSPRQHPLRVYALLELGIGVIGLAFLFILPQVDEIYAASHAGHGWRLRPRTRGCNLPLAADDADGSDAAGGRPVRRSDTARHFLAAFFTAATLPAPCLAVCWPASICCGCLTWRHRPMSPWRSMWSSQSLV